MKTEEEIRRAMTILLAGLNPDGPVLQTPTTQSFYDGLATSLMWVLGIGDDAVMSQNCEELSRIFVESGTSLEDVETLSGEILEEVINRPPVKIDDPYAELFASMMGRSPGD